MILGLTACTGTKSTTSSSSNGLTSADVKRVESKFPGITLDKLTEGKKLFEANCNICHGLDKSYGKSEEILNKYVPGMVGKSNKKQGKEVISAEGKDLILQYLVTLNSK